MNHVADVIVIGAGITGLSAAYYLQQLGLTVRVLDAQERIGGVIQTTETSGFILENGPQSLYPRAALVRLLEELELSDSICFSRRYLPDNSNSLATSSNSGKQIELRRHILSKQNSKKSRLVPMPRSLSELLSFRGLSVVEKMRLFLEPKVAWSSLDDESIAEFVSRRFGKAAWQILAKPVLSGMWAGDGSQLSCRSAFPALWNGEETKTSILLQHLKSRRMTRQVAALDSNSGFDPTWPIGFRKGLSQLPEELANKIGRQNISLNSKVLLIEKSAHGYRVDVSPRMSINSSISSISKSTAPDTLFTRAVLVTTPSQVAGQLLQPLSNELSQRLNTIPYTSVGILHLALDEADLASLPNISGFLLPAGKDRSLLGVTFNSRSFPHTAPSGKLLLTAFSGGAENPDSAEVENSKISELVLKELISHLGLKRFPLVLKATTAINAMPQYCLGHHQILEMVRDFNRQNPDCQIAGNWLQGVGISHRIDDAKLAAVSLSNVVEKNRASELQAWSLKKVQVG